MNTGDDFDGGASMRSRNSQYELSSSLFAQIPADILVNNHINATQLQSSHGSRTVAATKGVGDETEGVLDAASSPRRQERRLAGSMLRKNKPWSMPLLGVHKISRLT